MTLKLALFDLDGTLVDTAADLTAALNHALMQQGLGPLTTEAVRHLVGGGARLLCERGLQTHNQSPEEPRLQAMVADFLSYYSLHIADHSQPFEPILSVLQELKTKGWVCAVCTNKPEMMARQLLEALGLQGVFKVITGGDTFAFRKPDARHLLETVKMAGGTLKNTVMIGDSQTDASAADNANMPVVLVPWGYHGEEQDLHSRLLPSPLSAKELVIAIENSLGTQEAA